METPKDLHKRTSVVGRVPTASDLDYGEVAINFADGKLYYKDDSNNIRAFIDSARVQAIADAVEVVADAQLDSGETTILVTSLIDSNYVQSRTNETYLATIIDSAYVQARQADIFRDSNYITNTIAGNLSLGQIIRGLDPGVNSVENPSDFTQTMTSQITAGSGIALSGGSGWGTPLQISATDSGGIDSASVIALIDSDHVQNRQIKYTTADFADSDGVTNIVQGIVTASYVRARQRLYNTADFPDSAFVTGQGYLTTATTTALVDSAYVRARVRTDQDLRTTDDVIFGKITGNSGEFEKLKFDTTTYTDADVPDTLPTFAEGNLFYFQGPDALTYSNSNINVKIGQDEVVRVYNNTGSDIAQGKAGYVTGAANDFPTIASHKADAFKQVYKPKRSKTH